MKVNLMSDYCGLRLRSPIVAAASPLTSKMGGLQKLEKAGVGAVVLPSLFEEQIDHDELETQRLLDYGAENSPEVTGYFPEMQDYNTGPDSYLKLIAEAKKKLEIPVIASLNGSTSGGWLRYARMIQDEGADALELNIYMVATDPEITGDEVEQRYVEIVEEVAKNITVPVAVKVGPFFSSMANMAMRLKYAGAEGLVLFNRFLQPDIDLDEMQVVPHLQLSSSEEIKLALRWIAILRGRVTTSLAATSGAHTAADVVKLILAGADCVQLASSLLKKGPDQVRVLVHELEDWMKENEYSSVEQMKGSFSQASVVDPEAFERANYMKALTSYTSEFV